MGIDLKEMIQNKALNEWRLFWLTTRRSQTESGWA